MLGLVSGGIIFLNLLIILFFLPEMQQKYRGDKEESVIPLDFHHHKKQIYLLFIIAFILSLGFSSMQTTFSLLLSDRFLFDEKMVGYCLGFIGFTSILYQGFLIKYVRRFLDEKGMILF